LASTNAATIGAIQHRAIGLPAEWNSRKTLAISSSTFGSALVANVERFFAAPKPPEMRTVSRTIDVNLYS